MRAAENLGTEHEIMTELLKSNWKTVEMAKETMTDLVARIQPVVSALRKSPGN